MDLWVVATLGAALIQTVRFSLQKSLKTAGFSSGGATFSRFVFAAPLALALAALLPVLSDAPSPALGLRFWTMAVLGGLGQIVATMATVALISERNFAVGIAFTKSETVLVALFSMLFLGEAVTAAGLVAILVGLTGMLGMLGWFIAFRLQNAAYVRALGQVELVFSVLGSWLVFRERARPRELGGIALVVGRS